MGRLLENPLEDFLKTVPLFKPLESYDLMQLADCLQQQCPGDHPLSLSSTQCRPSPLS